MTLTHIRSASALGLAVLLCGAVGQTTQAAQRLEAGASTKGRTMAKQWVYVGTYTGGKSKGIYLFQLDPAAGDLTPHGLAAETANPSFLAIHPNGRFLYSVNEVSDFDEARSGSVTAFAIDTKTGKLTLLNRQSARGSGPCHLVVDPAGKNVLVANYGGGSVAALPIQADGSLAPATAFIQHEGSGADPRRQKGPHAHSINVDPSGRFAMAADLGLDKVLVYRFDADRGMLQPHEPPHAAVAPAAGPRHFAFHPDGRAAYVLNEMNSTVTAFRYDPASGKLATLHTLPTLPEGFQDNNSTAEIQVHPSGKFLYSSNRGHDSIAIFRIDAQTGRLTPAGHQPTGGKTPRNFGIDPTGRYLLAANQESGNIVVFRIDPATGALTRAAEVEAPTPVCVKFLPMTD